MGYSIIYYLHAKKQHEKIFEEFKSESEAKRKRGMVYTILYLIVSFGTPLYIAFFIQPHNKIEGLNNPVKKYRSQRHGRMEHHRP